MSVRIITNDCSTMFAKLSQIIIPVKNCVPTTEMKRVDNNK